MCYPVCPTASFKADKFIKKIFKCSDHDFIAIITCFVYYDNTHHLKEENAVYTDKLKWKRFCLTIACPIRFSESCSEIQCFSPTATPKKK